MASGSNDLSEPGANRLSEDDVQGTSNQCDKLFRFIPEAQEQLIYQTGRT